MARDEKSSEADHESRDAAFADGGEQVRLADTVACDACGSPMRPMGHCKYWCLACGFLRTCNDVI